MHYLIIDVHGFSKSIASTVDWMLYSEGLQLQDLGHHVHCDTVTAPDHTHIILHSGGSTWFLPYVHEDKGVHVSLASTGVVAQSLSRALMELPMFSSLERMEFLFNVPLDRSKVDVGVYTSIYIYLCLLQGRKIWKMMSCAFN